MDTQTSDNSPDRDLTEVLEIITEIARKSDGGNHIYRGERRPYPILSSSLYRQHQDIEAEDFDIEIVQAEILIQAKQYTWYTGEIDDFEVLSQLQHNGGETNLIDFTYDFLIALFFACDGEPSQNGRVILLSETGTEYDVQEPHSPAHRVIAQKSVFVRPHKGFVEPDDEVTIPSHLKPAVLDYLHRHHGISTETIYNDLHGFIRHRDIHQSAYAEFYKGFTLANKGNYQQAIYHYTNAIELNPQMAASHHSRGIAYYHLGNYVFAIEDYEMALSLNPDMPSVWHNLGSVHAAQGNYSTAIRDYGRALELEPNDSTQYYLCDALLHLGEWEKAKKELSDMTLSGMDIAALFRNDYTDIADFEQQSGQTLPNDIAEMLSE